MTTESDQAKIANDILRAAIEQIEAAGVPVHVMLDRLATLFAYTAVEFGGKDHAAGELRDMAAAVAGGFFDQMVRN